MFRQLIACLAIASPAAAQQAEVASPSAGNARDWTLEIAPNGCLVTAAAPNGTVVSIWGRTGEDNLRVLVQNTSWNSLEDGGRYALQVKFDGNAALPIEATARRNLDEDGPGLTFAVSPQPAAGGASFVDQFAASNGMHLNQDGKRLESVPLSGGRTAMTALAQCLSRVYSATASADTGSAEGTLVEVSADATPL